MRGGGSGSDGKEEENVGGCQQHFLAHLMVLSLSHFN